jgi:hypothetical protein
VNEGIVLRAVKELKCGCGILVAMVALEYPSGGHFLTHIQRLRGIAMATLSGEQLSFCSIDDLRTSLYRVWHVAI